MKNLKVLFTVLCVACATAVWGESIEINTSNSGVKGSYADNTFTISNVQFGYTQWMKNTNIQAKKSTTNSCYNVEAIPGTITKITVVQTGTARAIKMFGGTTAKPTSSITSPSTASKMVFDFSGKGYTYFSITTPDNACYFQTITIEYESSGSTETTVSYRANTDDSFTGPLPTDANTYANGDNITISDTRLTRTGYTHIGWNTDKNATEALNSLTATGSAITLYAIWKVNTYTITWKVSSKNYTEGTPTTSVEHGKSVSALPTEPSVPSGCSGKVFVGWTDEPISTGTDIKPDPLFKTAAEAPEVTENKIYYAVFADENGE